MMSDIAEKRRLVMCPGAAKAGTTSLYALMAQHPAVTVTRSKESDFFVDPRLYQRGYEYYWNSCYVQKPNSSVYFEADPIYMYARGCMARIRDCAPDARIVVMLRNPVDRAYSQYRYRMTYARYRESFAEMCDRESSRISRGDADRLEYGCLDRSRYAPQIREILTHFPSEHVYYIVFEKFIADQAAQFGKLLSWLGLPQMQVEPARENATAAARSVGLARLLYHPGYRGLRGAVGGLLPQALRRRVYSAVAAANSRDLMPEERAPLDRSLRRQLLSELRSDIVEVEELTGMDMHHWLESA
jgi:hypothetical protein